MIKNVCTSIFEVFSITCMVSFIWNLFMNRYFCGDEYILLYKVGLAYFKYEQKIMETFGDCELHILKYFYSES